MADINDYLEASRVTDRAMRSADAFGGQIEDGRESETDAALATLYAGNAIALAIRELGTRLDYVLREIGRRPTHPSTRVKDG